MDFTSELIKGLKRGDKISFELMYHNYSRIIYGEAYRITKSYDLSNKILERVFIEVWKNIDQFNYEEIRFKFWIIKITRYVTRDTLSAFDDGMI